MSGIASPIGVLALAVDEAGRLRGVSFGDGLRRATGREYPGVEMEAGETPEAIARPLADYFGGDLQALMRIHWSLEGAAAGDGFQARVWRALWEAPVGQTLSYGEMARRAGQPGAALNRNPIPLVLACHRVVGADGAMVGFGGGLERKTWLLRHEGALLI